MTTTTGNPHTYTPADQGRARHLLLRDDRGRLTLRRLRPWHRMLARYAAARLDRELAAGTSPETSATLATRAIQLTSMRFRRDLATSVQRILAATGEPLAIIPSQAAAGHPPRFPLHRAQIRQCAGPLAQLAGSLAAPGPVPVQGVAMVSQLLADGTSPLYRPGCGEDLGDIIENAARALTRLTSVHRAAIPSSSDKPTAHTATARPVPSRPVIRARCSTGTLAAAMAGTALHKAGHDRLRTFYTEGDEPDDTHL